MKAVCRIGRAPGNGRERHGHRHSHLRWQPLAALLCIAFALVTVSTAIWSRPAGLARAQEETGTSDTPLPGQVIAQGIARLPGGEVAWTVRGVDVSGDAGTAVESFPVGFVITGDNTIALLDADGEVLNILEPGEAAFLPNGRSGALASWETEAASLYEVALVPGEDASAGETRGALVGEPFVAPEGEAFDVELARETLNSGEQTTIPISHSGAPVLFLQTAGSVQLEGGNGQVVELTTGQFAMLSGEVLARGAGDEPSTFVVAAIGAAAGRDGAEAGTPEARAGRAERQQARQAARGEATAGGEDTASDGGARERRPRRVRTGGGGGGGGGRGGGEGQGGQTAPRGTGGGTGGVPITGGVDATIPAGAPVGTPAMEPTAEATLPADTTPPADGTPPVANTIPADESPPVDETVVPGDEAPADSTVTPEPTAPAGDAVPTEEASEGEPAPAVETPPAADTAPIEEAPVEEAAPTAPVIEEEVTEPASGA